MENGLPNAQPPVTNTQIGLLKILGIILLATTLATAVTLWAVTYYIFPNEFKPVTLSLKEERLLDRKLEKLNTFQSPRNSHKPLRRVTSESPLEPERYSEVNASREIFFSEKELNSLLANNTDLARKLAIDLSDDLASARILIPLDQDLPILGGKTLKVAAGLALAYHDGKPVVALTGVSVWGVPLPNAWLGNLKNVDLVREFGDRGGFWSAFAEGIETIKIEEGSLRIKLKE